MRQHVEANVPADEYTKLQIECRTTFCELKMAGTRAEGRTLADQVASDVALQPWSDVALNGSGGSSDGANWTIEYEFYRPRTESERRLRLQHRGRP